MIVQINSDIKSYSESLNTLKFAERVSGVELGAARSTKEVEDVRELIEQVLSLIMLHTFHHFMNAPNAFQIICSINLPLFPLYALKLEAYNITLI